jgi:hypothetical protein
MKLMQSTTLFTRTPAGKRSRKRQTVKVTLWMKPPVKAEIQRIAAQEHLSLSKVGAAGLEEWVHRHIHNQHETLLYPTLRQIIREERQASDNRIVFFLMRIAFAAEQSRILITNILDRILRRDGAPEHTLARLVDQSNTLAKRNIIKKTEQMKSLLDEWDVSFQDG